MKARKYTSNEQTTRLTIQYVRQASCTSPGQNTYHRHDRGQRKNRNERGWEYREIEGVLRRLLLLRSHLLVLLQVRYVTFGDCREDRDRLATSPPIDIVLDHH